MDTSVLRRAEDSTDEFLTLIQNPFQSAFQINAVWASLGTSLGITLLLALLFSLCRPRNSVVYAPKVKHADRKHAPPPVGKGIFAWVNPVLKTPELEIVDRIGLDGAVFLRFTRMCRNIFLACSVLGCAVMIPINITQSNTNGQKGLSVFSLMTPLSVYNNPLWSQIACSWAFDAIVMYFLWANYRVVRDLRKRYFMSQEYQMSMHARTILVRHIPPSYRTDEGLLRITDEVNPTPAVPRAAIGRNVKELPKLIKEHEETVRQLEEVLAKYFKNPDRLPPNRPTCRPAKKYKGDHPAGKVDAIDYLTERIRDLEVEIKFVRESIDTRNAMSYGFASWDSIENAHAVAYAARNKHPQNTTILLAPRPNDIIWENLALTRGNRRWRRFLNFIWSTVLTVIWIAPNAMIAVFLSDLSNLGRVWPAFQTELGENPKVWAAVQGIAAPALTSLIYLILPIIFRRLATHSGDITKTSRERHVIHSLYAFFVFNNLVVFSIFSAVWGFVSTVIDAKNHDEDAWHAILAGDFYNKIVRALCTVSPFWVTWLLQRNLGAAIDLVQLINMVWIWFARKFLTPTPRSSIEWTAPQPFLYASYYNYFLFYVTVALCFSTLQPIVLPVTALYFAIDAWLKKYLLLYVFITKTESGGRYWRVIYNRMLFAVFFGNCVTALVVTANGSWAMLFSLVPLPFIILAFKWYCKRTFDLDIEYYARSVPADAEALVDGKQGKKVGDRLKSRFGHPALYRPLTTPMVHAKAADALEKILANRQGLTGGVNNYAGEYSDIAMHNMSTSQPGKTSNDHAANAPFEVVTENQLDFSYFKDRPDFRDEFGGGIYGRADDLITERSNTPRSFAAGGGAGSAWGSPSSSRAASPTPSQYSAYKPPIPHIPSLPNIHDHPAFRSASGDVGERQQQQQTGMYKVSSESESRLLSNVQGPPLQSQSSNDLASLDRWDSSHSRDPYSYAPVRERDSSPMSYDAYRRGGY